MSHISRLQFRLYYLKEEHKSFSLLCYSIQICLKKYVDWIGDTTSINFFSCIDSQVIISCGGGGGGGEGLNTIVIISMTMNTD